MNLNFLCDGFPVSELCDERIDFPFCDEFDVVRTCLRIFRVCGVIPQWRELSRRELVLTSVATSCFCERDGVSFLEGRFRFIEAELWLGGAIAAVMFIKLCGGASRKNR